MSRKPYTRLIAVAAVAVLAGMAGLATKTGGAQAGPAPAAKPASLAVELVQPARADWPLVLSTSGPLSAWQEATISAETAGLRITALHADVGTRVKRGQLVAELASSAVQAEVRKAEAVVASAEAELKSARSNVRRGTTVRASGTLSGQQIEQYEIAEQTATARLQSAEADLQTARIRLGHTRITAVDDGVISARLATLGTVVGTGTELFTLVRNDRVEWRAEIDAAQLAQLRIGQRADVSLPNGVSVSGRVRQLSPTLDDKSRTAIAYVELPKDAAARSGTYASGTIALGERPATVLPSSAIVLRDGRSYVFEVDAERGTVIQHAVTTGRVREGQVEIVTGLKPAARVVRSGGAFLNDGDAVRIDAGKGAA